MKTTAGKLLSRIISKGFEDELLIMSREKGGTKVSCAAFSGSAQTVAYMIAGTLVQLSSTFNITPVSFAAIIVDALNQFISFEQTKEG